MRNYKTTKSKIASVISGESNLIANLANVCAILKEDFDFFWCGFYFADEKSSTLVLGPFQGPLACTRIPFEKGVCGDSFSRAETIVVDNVHDYPGHIACSSLSNSEIVIPIIKDGRVLAVLDIDSREFSDFNELDKKNLEDICQLLTELFP